MSGRVYFHFEFFLSFSGYFGIGVFVFHFFCFLLPFGTNASRLFRPIFLGSEFKMRERERQRGGGNKRHSVLRRVIIFQKESEVRIHLRISVIVCLYAHCRYDKGREKRDFAMLSKAGIANRNTKLYHTSFSIKRHQLKNKSESRTRVPSMFVRYVPCIILIPSY